MLPFVQRAFNTSSNTTVREAPKYFMFGRQAKLLVDIILGIPDEGHTADAEEHTKQTQDNLQLYFCTRKTQSEKTCGQAEIKQ